MKKGKLIDLVIAGPDMSGTSTQVKSIIDYFKSRDFNGADLKVRDVGGTEIDALFHTEEFNKIAKEKYPNFIMGGYDNFREFFDVHHERPLADVFLRYANDKMSGRGQDIDLKVASMVDNKVSTYIDPNSAEVWVSEEPTRRGAGQVVRNLELNRSEYGLPSNFAAAAEAHSIYRSDEAFRFRLPFRKMVLEDESRLVPGIWIRSRSEESAAYQIFDEKNHPRGADRDYYFNLEGHKVAFANPPTHIFIVAGLDGWTPEDYIKLKAERSGDRIQDDYEKDAPYQAMVNNRYASDWMEDLYKEGNERYGGEIPKITRFSIYDSKEEIQQKMYSELDKIFAA